MFKLLFTYLCKQIFSPLMLTNYYIIIENVMIRKYYSYFKHKYKVEFMEARSH